MLTKKQIIFVIVSWLIAIAGLIAVWYDIRNDEIIRNISKAKINHE